MFLAKLLSLIIKLLVNFTSLGRGGHNNFSTMEGKKFISKTKCLSCISLLR